MATNQKVGVMRRYGECGTFLKGKRNGRLSRSGVDLLSMLEVCWPEEDGV